jgi:hypothetical protein
MLLFVVASAVSSLPAQQQPRVSSGHHYSFLEGAQIGHDFGRNPFVRSSRDAASLGFATDFGGSRLDQALARAVSAGKTRMSFDLGFDLRSIVVFENGLAISLDSVDAFLTALDQADANAQKRGSVSVETDPFYLCCVSATLLLQRTLPNCPADEERAQ